MRKLGNTEPQQPSTMRENYGPMFVCMGPSGAGKTSMLETLNDSAYTPVCELDIDGKAHVLTDRQDRDVFPCHTWEDLDKHMQELAKQRLHPQYKTVCIDGGTALQQILSYNKHHVREITNPQLRQSAYGNSNLDLVNLAQTARILAESGMHIILNLWSMREKDTESSEMVRIMPDLTPTMLNRFLGLFDYVVYLEPNNPPKPYPPVMQWGGSITTATRAATSPESPLAHMPDKIYKPSWADIFNAYHGTPFNLEAHTK